MTDLSKFKDLFISEAEDNLLKLSDGLIAMEKKLGKAEAAEITQMLDNLMRASHTIKGSSATMGYNKMAFLTHVMEDVFDSARDKKLELDSETMNLIFSCIDSLEKSLESIKVKDKEIDVEKMAAKLKKKTGVETVGTGKSVRNKSDAAAAPVLPKVEKPEPEKKEKTAAAAEPAKKSATDTASADSAAVAKIDYIKVPVERLDTLMDLVEELLIDKMRIEQMIESLPQLKEISNHLSFLVSSIQYNVMQARLVPVEQIFARFPRMVRDLATQQGKEVDLVITGGEIELDRTIVDKLGEPLVHLLRNAIDHGINKKGTVKLKAKRESDYVLILVENDNNCIDYEAVKRVAVRKGIVSEKEIETYSEGQLLQLLFHSRLSTSEQVTEISGRGVGLSIVKNFVDGLGGRVVVENLKEGVRFSLELPLTMAIINSLLVKIDGDIFAIPFSNIDRSVSVPKEDIKRMADFEVAVIDGTDVPLLRVGRIFGNQGVQEDGTEVLAVLIKKGKESIGIIVDGLLSEQEIIVKPLSSVLRSIKGFSGSTILGDGKTVLILDVINLLKTINNNYKTYAK